MEIKRVVTGYLEENCYVISENNKAIIIDPGDEAQKIIENIGDLSVVGVLITHHHFDHVGALDEILKYYNVKELNLKIGKNKVDCFNIDVVETKGHTSDSKTYYFYDYNLMFTGDFLFKNSIGRTDLDTGNETDMLNSLSKIKTYDKDIVIYPGHGEKSTLCYEFENNYFLI